MQEENKPLGLPEKIYTRLDPAKTLFSNRGHFLYPGQDPGLGIGAENLGYLHIEPLTHQVSSPLYINYIAMDTAYSVPGV